MDMVLLGLTLISLGAAALFGVVAWRLLREERARTAARVAALSEAIEAVDRADGGDFEAPPAGAVAAGARLFEPPATVKGRPVLKAAVVALMATVVVVMVAMRQDDRPGGTAPDTSRGEQGAPLELMSMRHAREGRTLTVTGLVRNPPAGAEARRVTAVVFAFDRAGGFLGSARAPLDFLVLAPDDESPFVVTLQDIGDVARYRVSFRTDAGLLRHLDRRASQVQLAGNQ
jgi:hypothetical protein